LKVVVLLDDLSCEPGFGQRLYLVDGTAMVEVYGAVCK
jgi:hypothetical protein